MNGDGARAGSYRGSAKVNPASAILYCLSVGWVGLQPRHSVHSKRTTFNDSGAPRCINNPHHESHPSTIPSSPSPAHPITLLHPLAVFRTSFSAPYSTSPPTFKHNSVTPVHSYLGRSPTAEHPEWSITGLNMYTATSKYSITSHRCC